jgi:hypothetical protein
MCELIILILVKSLISAFTGESIFCDRTRAYGSVEEQISISGFGISKFKQFLPMSLIE